MYMQYKAAYKLYGETDKKNKRQSYRQHIVDRMAAILIRNVVHTIYA